MRAEVDAAVGVDGVCVVDGLIGEGADDADQQHVERFDAVRRLGDELDAFDQQDVRRLDDVARQRHLFQFARHAAGRRRLGRRERASACRGAMNAVQPVGRRHGGDQQQGQAAEGWWHAFMSDIPLEESLAGVARAAVAPARGDRRRGAAYVTVTMRIIGKASQRLCPEWRFPAESPAVAAARRWQCWQRRSSRRRSGDASAATASCCGRARAARTAAARAAQPAQPRESRKCLVPQGDTARRRGAPFV